VVRGVPGSKNRAAAQGVRGLVARLGLDDEERRFVNRLRQTMSTI
jgi:hypothetical protein